MFFLIFAWGFREIYYGTPCTWERQKCVSGGKHTERELQKSLKNSRQRFSIVFTADSPRTTPFTQHPIGTPVLFWSAWNFSRKLMNHSERARLSKLIDSKIGGNQKFIFNIKNDGRLPLYECGPWFLEAIGYSETILNKTIALSMGFFTLILVRKSFLGELA